MKGFMGSGSIIRHILNLCTRWTWAAYVTPWPFSPDTQHRYHWMHGSLVVKASSYTWQRTQSFWTFAI